MNALLENIFSDVDFINRTVRRFNNADYELYKKRIDKLSLKPEEHSGAVKRLAEVMKL